MIAKRERTRGIAVEAPVKPKGYLAVEADRILAEREERRKAAAIARAEREVPNTICYKEAFADWKPGDKVPRCNRCDGLLHPGENHKCEGYKPKYEVWSDERKELAAARREATREARQPNRIVCSVCGDEIPEYEDAEWHWEDHEGRPEREHHAVNGDEDDLSGYEDYDDGDYCEGDDDGWDCD